MIWIDFQFNNNKKNSTPFIGFTKLYLFGSLNIKLVSLYPNTYRSYPWILIYITLQIVLIFRKIDIIYLKESNI